MPDQKETEGNEIPKTKEEADWIAKEAFGRRPDFPSGKDFVDKVRQGKSYLPKDWRGRILRTAEGVQAE